jgi:hypothetical protein
MPKKSKGKKKVKRKVRQRGATAGAIPPTTQQQFTPIHNQALKNKARDDAQATREAQASEKEFKMDTLKLQRAYVEKKLSLLV